jgi:hypothetical protein
MAFYSKKTWFGLALLGCFVAAIVILPFGMGFLVSLFGLPISFVVFYFYCLSTPTTAKELLREDRRRPVLILRSFVADDRLCFFRKKTPYDREHDLIKGEYVRDGSFEIFLRDFFSRAGPVITIGDPNEPLTPPGAGRLWVSNAQWRNRVEELIDESQLIVVIVGAIKGEDGLAWELGKVFSIGKPGKLIIVAPPLRAEQVEECWNACGNHSHGKLPSYKKGSLVARFHPCWIPFISGELHGDLPTRQEYETAFDEMEPIADTRAKSIGRLERVIEWLFSEERFKWRTAAFLGVFVVLAVLGQWEKEVKNNNSPPSAFSHSNSLIPPTKEEIERLLKGLEVLYLKTPEGREFAKKLDLQWLTAIIDCFEHGVTGAEKFVEVLREAEQILEDQKRLDKKQRAELEDAYQKHLTSLDKQTAQMTQLCTEVETMLDTTGNALPEEDEKQRTHLLQRLQSSKKRLEEVKRAEAAAWKRNGKRHIQGIRAEPSVTAERLAAGDVQRTNRYPRAVPCW